MITRLLAADRDMIEFTTEPITNAPPAPCIDFPIARRYDTQIVARLGHARLRGPSVCARIIFLVRGEPFIAADGIDLSIACQCRAEVPTRA